MAKTPPKKQKEDLNKLKLKAAKKILSKKIRTVMTVAEKQKRFKRRRPVLRKGWRQPSRHSGDLREGTAYEILKFIMPINPDEYEKAASKGTKAERRKAVAALAGKDTALLLGAGLLGRGASALWNIGKKALTGGKAAKVAKKAGEAIPKNVKTGPSMLEKNKEWEKLKDAVVAARKKKQSLYARAEKVANKATNQSGREARNTLKTAEGMRNRARGVLTDELKRAQRKLKKHRELKAPIPLDQPLKLKQPSPPAAKPKTKDFPLVDLQVIIPPGRTTPKN